MEPIENSSGFTLRAFITGSILCLLVAIAAQYSINIVHGSYLAVDHIPAGGIFVFSPFTFVINTILRKLKIGFSSPELLLISQGGYFPHPDHDIPPDISWENFQYYIELLGEIKQKG